MAATLYRSMSLAALVALVMGGSADAHHSYAMFDRSKTMAVTGAVKELQWTNPHVWLQVLVPGSDGKAMEYGFEGNGPSGMARIGWSEKIVKPGDKVSVSYYPLKNGAPGGELHELTLPSGVVLANRIPQLSNGPPAGG